MNSTINTGFLLVNKPVGVSSYGCIGRIKKILRDAYEGQVRPKIKIGHAGTLDPFASGLLVIALGREATRLLSECMAMDKTYIAMGKCGELTDTLDCTGTVVSTADYIPSEQELRQSLEDLGSSYEQIPPLYSALKYQGKPLYLLARHKKMDTQELEEIASNKRRVIQLYDKNFLSYDSPFFTIQVRVSKGTYIRTLINDIAVKAGSCATTYELCRASIGDFNLSSAIDVFQCNTIDDINAYIIPIDLFFSKKP